MKFVSALSATLAALAGGTALAQPAVFTDIGAVGGPAVITRTFAVPGPGTIVWFKFTTAGNITNTSTSYLDIDNEGTLLTGSGTFPNDTEIGLYRDTGAVVASDDDDGSGTLSQLTFGNPTAPRPAIGDSLTYTGRDATAAVSVPAGTYYLACGVYDMAFNAAFGAAHTANARTVDSTGTYQVNWRTNLPQPVAPTDIGFSFTAANPNPVGTAGSTTLLTATVVPAQTPTPSTGIVVTANLAAIGGSSTQAFFDNGTNGDVTAGDNIYSFSTPVTAAVGTLSLPVSVADAQARTGSGVIGLTVVPPTAIDITTTSSSAAVHNVAANAAVTITATVVKGTFPTSSGFAMTIDLSALGGSATQPMFDDGTNGDVTANNNVYSLQIPDVGAVSGFYTLPVTASDAQGRSALAYIVLAVSAPPAPISAQIRPLVGGSYLAFSRIAAGANPVSTGATISADLTAFGGGASDQLFDDGTNGDVTAGDGNFSRSIVTMPTAAGTYVATFTASDAQGRSHSRQARFVIVGLIDGSDNNLNTSDVITRTIPASRGSITWVRFSTATAAVSDGAATVAPYLDIDTAGSGVVTALATGNGDIEDTELGLYNSTGALEDTDDDDGPNQNSQLSYGDTAPTRPNLGGGAVTPAGVDGALAAGNYHLALGNFDCTFTAGFNANSTNLFAEPGSHILNFRTNFPSQQCSLADVGITGGAPGHDNRLDNNDFIVFINLFFAQAPAADLGVTGGTPGHDGLWDNNDFIVFINIFFNDAPNCTG